jgi:hypothetical protein
MRPAQDCTKTYGGAVVVNRIVTLSETQYEEVPVRRIEPIAPYRQGLHTLCPAGPYTLIDGKRWRFHPLDPLRKLLSGRRTERRRRRLRRRKPPS